MAKWCNYCRKADHTDDECWCTRAIPAGAQYGYARPASYPPSVKAGKFATIPDEAPGFHDVNLPLHCKDSEHNFPTHLHIPGGKKYVHYCPSCRAKSVRFGLEVTF